MSKNPPEMQEMQLQFLGQNSPQSRKWQPTPVFLPGKSKSHGQRSLVGYSPWGHKRVGYNLATKQQQTINTNKTKTAHLKKFFNRERDLETV